MELMLKPWVEFGCKGNGVDVEAMGGNFLIIKNKKNKKMVSMCSM
jgi:hypothetical protein